MLVFKPHLSWAELINKMTQSIPALYCKWVHYESLLLIIQPLTGCEESSMIHVVYVIIGKVDVNGHPKDSWDQFYLCFRVADVAYNYSL